MALTDDHLRALGRVSANFSALELYLGRLCIVLLAADVRYGEVVVAHLPFQRRLDVAGALARLRLQEGDALLTRLDTILKRASEVEQERNRVVHGVWWSDAVTPSDSVTLMKVSAKRDKGLRYGREDVSSATLGLLADRIREVVQTIGLATGEVMARVGVPPGVTIEP